MTIQQCKYVMKIAKTGSFSEAAKQLFIAQSSLSISIKQLEQELGIKIFERSGNGVYLTNEGEEFVSYATHICESHDFIADRYSNRNIQKRLYIATQHYDFIADIFGNFLKKFNTDSYRFSIREIETGHCDIGIIAIKDGDYDVMKRYLGNKKLTFEKLLIASPHVFLRKEHPLANSSRLANSDLKKYPYVSYEQGEHDSSFFTEELTDMSYIDRHIEISDRATLMNVLMLTDSYTIGTGIMPSALNKGDIVSVPFESDESYIIGYLLNDERKISEVTQAFINQLENTIIRKELIK